MANDKAIQKRADIDSAVARVDEIAAAVAPIFGRQSGSMLDEVKVARAIVDMKAAMSSDVMAPIMALMNTGIGFATDKDPSKPGKDGAPARPYTEDVIKDVVIEAKLRGFHVVGNEFNVIAGRFYAAKAGLKRKVKTHPGVTDYRDTFEIPNVNGVAGNVAVKCKASWKLNGVPDELAREFNIRVNQYMGPDAVLGKAERKMLRAVHDALTGHTTEDGDVVDNEGPRQIEVATAKIPRARTAGGAGTRFLEPTANTPDPEDNIPMGDAPTAPVRTPQEDLATRVIEAGFTWAQFAAWAVEMGHVDPDCSGFDEMPNSKCLMLSAKWDSVRAQLAAATMAGSGSTQPR
jgi:hypothetical protein